jgi:anti-sigma regulatory factor (Ser/Thr protein kinase)
MSLADQIRLIPSAAEVSRVNGWFDQKCAESGIEKTLAADLKLCINEVLANQISYGFKSTSSPWVVVKIRLRPGRAVAKIVDNGTYFDLRGWRLPANRDAATSEPGGYGILLIRERASRIRYARFCGLNRLMIVCEGVSP